MRGKVAEIQVAAADRRAGRVVENIDVHHPAMGKGDIDLISNGTLWQIKVGQAPHSFQVMGEEIENWAQKAVEAARDLGKTKVGFRLDAEAMQWFNQPEVQAKLNALKEKYRGIITFEVEQIPTPPVP